MLKKIINLIFLIIFVFIFLNVILAIVWPYITDSRLKSQKFYDDEILKILGIEKNEESAFYKQMWIDRIDKI